MTYHLRGARVGIVGVLTPCAVVALAQAQCYYDVTILMAEECPPYGIPATRPAAVNDHGVVCGSHCNCICKSDVAFIWTGGEELIPIPMPAGTWTSQSWDVNGANWVIGEFNVSNDEYGQLGFVWRPDGTMDILWPPAGPHLQPNAVNDDGWVVGSTSDGTAYFKAFVWRDGELTLVLPTWGPRSTAVDVSDGGLVVGWMGTSQEIDGRAFVWEHGVLVDLGLPQRAFGAAAYDVSENGEIVGSAWYPPPGGTPQLRRASLWANGDVTDLGSLDGYERCSANGIRDPGLIVGHCSHREPGVELPPDQAVIWLDGKLVSLNEMISPNQQLHLVAAGDVNEHGQISCSGRTSNGLSVGVLLTPRDPPITDLNGDCRTDEADLSILLRAWGEVRSSPADFDGNGVVGPRDLALLLAHWSD